MALLQFCKTPRAIILVGLRMESGPLMFGTESYFAPGLYFEPQNRNMLNDEIIEKVNSYFDEELNNFDIVQEFSEEISLQDSSKATLYLATVDAPKKVQKNTLFTLPTLLRKMPKDRKRLSYLKAWQVLTGSLTLDTRAYEASEAELEKLATQNPEITH